jgi:hypothetical protein
MKAAMKYIEPGTHITAISTIVEAMIAVHEWHGPGFLE